jgi:lipopolysaccharide export system protein LptC
VLEGHARVYRAAAAGAAGAAGGGQAGLDFRSEWMFIDARNDRVHTNRPVTLMYGDSRFAAGGLRYDHVSEDLELDGPVRGHIMPSKR